MKTLVENWYENKNNFMLLISDEYKKVRSTPKSEKEWLERLNKLTRCYHTSALELEEELDKMRGQLEMITIKHGAGIIEAEEHRYRGAELQERMDEAVLEHLCYFHHHSAQYFGLEKAQEILVECIGEAARYVIEGRLPQVK